MNKTLLSVLGFGAGVAATMYSSKSDMLNKRQMKKLRRQVKRIF
ncbi:YrzQ family protein [Bacillus seohaeanensis]|uniref:YrzQ family protein n=1 Tax=Bacillus seohaeanensis TaxID=284580 RepID=A0ABW5RS45_9BACI